MADDPNIPSFTDDFTKTLGSDGFGIGQLADGSIDTFPLSELADRLRERDQREAAEAAVDLEDEPDDLSDLDEVVKAFG